MYLIKVELSNLLLQTGWETGVHAATTRQHNVSVQEGTGVQVSLVDTIEQLLVDTSTLNINEVGLEEGLRGLEPLTSDLDHTAIREL